MLWASVRLRFPCEGLLTVALERIEREIAKLTVRELSIIAWSVAKMEYKSRSLNAAISRAAKVIANFMLNNPGKFEF